MKHERIKNIENYLIENESVSLDTLCEVFEVSKNTIRRDVAELLERGLVKKVYGGITLNIQEETIPYLQRTIQNVHAKSKIGKLASTLVTSGDTLFIDSGSTTTFLIQNLKHLENVTIVTNSLNILLESTLYPNINVISTGGILQRGTNSFVGIESLKFLKGLNISKAFISTTGVSINNGITSTSFLESEIKKILVGMSKQVILMVDHTKFDSSSLISYCTLRDINCIVTDLIPSAKYSKYCEDKNIRLIYE